MYFFQQPAAKLEADTEKNQGRYNLRRRKDDGDAKVAEAKSEQQKEKEATGTAAAAAPSTRLDFGGKMGELEEMKKALSCVHTACSRGGTLRQ